MFDNPQSLSLYRDQAPASFVATVGQGAWKMVAMLAYA